MDTKTVWTVGTLVVALAAPSAWAVAEAEPAADDGTAMEEEAAPTGHVARSTFTHGIEDREPQDEIVELTSDEEQIFYFTELRELEGQTVVHRWEWNEQIMAEVAFEVGAQRWRVSSSKNLDPEWLGQWTVSVVDSGGHVLSAQQFEYVAASEASDSMAAPPAAPAE